MNPDLEKRTCISYLDEVNAYDISNISTTSIVSITSLKQSYIDNLESKWKELRVKYNISQGTYLHFTEIKKLLDVSGKSKHNEDIRKIFIDEKNVIDFDKLYSFYIDVLQIISSGEFAIQATGLYTLRKSNSLPKYIGVNSLMYQLFRDHLDRMGFYLAYLTHQDLEDRKLVKGTHSNPKPEFYKTKLRYDGDEELNYHSDLRNAFSHCIVDGTKHFDSKATKNMFDNLKFVSKDQVANCTNCATECGYEIVSHAGHELIDFIALYVARDMWKPIYRDFQLSNGKTEDEIEANIRSLTLLQIPGRDAINPIDYIYPKLFSTEHIAKYKIIQDYPY